MDFKQQASKMTDILRTMFSVTATLPTIERKLATCHTADGKHINFDALEELSEKQVRGMSHSFAKDISTVVNFVDEDGLLPDDIVLECGMI